MTSPFWTKDQYGTHFFCALCGGPFARVYRTNDPSRPRARHEPNDEVFSLPTDPNRLLPAPGEIDEPAPAPWQRSEPEPQPAILRAYAGADIAVKDMRWTRVLRALIHRGAEAQPEGGEEHAADDQFVYLSGRGSVLEHGSWAQAHPSIQHDLDAEQDDDDRADPDRDHLRFHLYQEPDRNDRKFYISSIPFHDTCWDILQQALQSARASRALPTTVPDNVLSLNDVWLYLCDRIPVAVDGKFADLSLDALSAGTADDAITRLSIGCMAARGYGEAQFCGLGPKWLHRQGLHWLVANPRRKLDFLALPLDDGSGPGPSRPARPPASSGRAAISLANRVVRDPFLALPAEVLFEMLAYLTCRETFRWRVASIAVHLLTILNRDYIRFLRDQMRFLPTYIQDLENNVVARRSTRTRLDWRRIFEKSVQACRKHDGLRNRRRLWTILQPMADEIVETAPQHLRHLSRWPAERDLAVSLVRGCVGRMSGAEGHRDTTLFFDTSRADGARLDRLETWTGPGESDAACLGPDLFARSLSRLGGWLDVDDGHVKGLDFHFAHPEPSPEWPWPGWTASRRIGSRTARYAELALAPGPAILTGLVVCWYDGCVRGVRAVFEDGGAAAASDPLEVDVEAEAASEWLSAPLGLCRGPVRRLVAPRSCRDLAGLTAFVSRTGDLETLAILERKRAVRRRDGGSLMPPDTVPLSHREASLWTRLPPRDVEMLERQGPTVADWRLRPAEFEVFEATARSRPPGRLAAVTAFRREPWLTGLRFHYLDDDGAVSSRDLGPCVGDGHEAIALDHGADQLRAVLVSHGAGGVHGVQFISDRRVGPIGAERYLGTAVIHAPEAMVRRVKEKFGALDHLYAPLIGFHCLSDAAAGRVLQLGLVTRVEVLPRGSPISVDDDDGPEAGPSRLAAGDGGAPPLPFVEVDEVFCPWVDGAPPPTFLYERKRHDSLKTMALAVGATMTGWVDLRPEVSRIVVYGRMEGLEVVYADGALPAKHFGNTALASSRLAFDAAALPAGRARRITRIGQAAYDAGLRHVPADLSEDVIDYCRTITFLGSGQRCPADVASIEVDSAGLAGVKLDFASDRIVRWQPYVDMSLLGRGRGPTAASSEQQRHRRDHWKSPSALEHWPSAETDVDVLGKYAVLADFFAGPDGGEAIDGLRGYMQHQRFCGLRFRRAGLWDDEALGLASAHATEFLLEPGEYPTSIYVAENRTFGNGGALAVCTNRGRSSAWIGSPMRGKAVLKTAPAGRRVVGIFMGYSTPERCDTVGLIHDELASGAMEMSEAAVAPVPRAEISKRDLESGLEWTTDPRQMPDEYECAAGLDFHETLLPMPERAWVVLEPERLLRVDGYVNAVPAHFGLMALRFESEAAQGRVLLGNWQSRYARPTEQQMMKIAGPTGERIVKLDLTFHHPSGRFGRRRPQPVGKRIVGLRLTTNLNRQQDIGGWQPFTQDEPPSWEVSRVERKCPRRREIVGFHYVIGLYVYDIGLITRKVSRPRPS